jgi:ankyrin repeat protein
MFSSSAKRQSVVLTPVTNRKRMSVSNRLSVTFGLSPSGFGHREPFVLEEAKNAGAADIALRIAKKDPTLPCSDDCRKYTPLHVAAGLGKEDIVKLILAEDVSGVNAVAKLGLTPLHVAVASRQWRIVHILLAAGANAKLKDTSGRTPYKIALDDKAPETIVSLLSPGQPVFMSHVSHTSFSSSSISNDNIIIQVKEDV